MNKIFCKILFFIAFIIGSLTLFFNHSLNGYCLAVPTLETALWNGMNVASEYLCGRSGKRLHNANEVSANIDGINLGSVSGDYGTAQANASGISVPFDINYINQYTTDADFSSLSAEDRNKLATALCDDPNANNGSLAFKMCTYGYVTLYWAVDQLGNWVGKSLNNVMCTLDTKSASQTLALDNSLDNLYPNNLDSVYFSDNQGFTFEATTPGNYGYQYGRSLSFTTTSPIFTYGYQNKLYIVAPSSCFNGSQLLVSASYGWVYVNSNKDETPYNLSADYISINGYSKLGTFDGVDWYYGRIYGTQQYQNVFDNWRLSSDFSSLEDIRSFLTSRDYFTDTINSELVDSNQDGYTVPDIGSGFASIISDIYEVIDTLRDSLTGVLDGNLTATVDDTLADAIADAIADALSKGLAITDENSGGNGGGGSTEDPTWSLPTWIIPPFIQDIFPEGTFELFRPIFYIVPEAYTSYSLWILIPTIIIFVIFIYFVVSVL